MQTCITSPPYWGLRCGQHGAVLSTTLIAIDITLLLTIIHCQSYDYGLANFVGLDMQPKYLELARERIDKTQAGLL